MTEEELTEQLDEEWTRCYMAFCETGDPERYADCKRIDVLRASLCGRRDEG